MKKILIDTNILLDIAFKRSEFYSQAHELLMYIESHAAGIKAYLSANTITDIYYIVAKKENKETAINFITDILQLFDVAGIDKEVIHDAIASGFSDFEDAVQECAARNNKLEMIITRNKKDFAGSILEILTPEEFLSAIGSV